MNNLWTGSGASCSSSLGCGLFFDLGTGSWPAMEWFIGISSIAMLEQKSPHSAKGFTNLKICNLNTRIFQCLPVPLSHLQRPTYAIVLLSCYDPLIALSSAKFVHILRTGIKMLCLCYCHYLYTLFISILLLRRRNHIYTFQPQGYSQTWVCLVSR